MNSGKYIFGGIMLFSLAIIFIVGFLLASVFNKVKLPGLVGLIITGIVLGPYVLNLISSDVLDISSELRKIALIVILLKAGLTLDIEDLKMVGRPAILMSFIPATLEIIIITLIAPLMFNISYLEGAIMGCVVAAVSPAVVVPRMIKLIHKGYGKDKKIPHMVLAGASVDDVYVIVLFTAFMGMYTGGSFSAVSLLNVPISIIAGLALGIIIGIVLSKFFKAVKIRDTIKVLVIMSISFLVIELETVVKPYFMISGLLAVMALGGTMLKTHEKMSKRIIGKFTKIWVAAEVMLFVLVGAAVDITTIPTVGLYTVLLIFVALTLRIIGVYISLYRTDLNVKERLFCAFSYMPKATVQAAIGAIPLSMGVKSGNIILSVAVLAIIITAPLGAALMDNTYKTLLSKDIKAEKHPLG
jgi:solute carrier family 9B (sodium/hydrogen exchanger), member 1/2